MCEALYASNGAVQGHPSALACANVAESSHFVGGDLSRFRSVHSGVFEVRRHRMRVLWPSALEILEVLGGRFPSAVVPFRQSDDSPGLVPAEPGKAEARYFRDIFTARTLFPNARTIPRELYVPHKKEVYFNELCSPFDSDKIFP